MEYSQLVEKHEDEGLVTAFEAAVAEVVAAFVGDPNQPIHAGNPPVRLVLLRLEETLSVGLTTKQSLVEGWVAGSSPSSVQPTPALDPLWAAFKDVRLSGSLDDCAVLERLLCETDSLTLTRLCIAHGWGWCRWFLISCLNQHLLITFLESLVADDDLLVRAYTCQALVRQPSFCTRVVAAAAALNGVHFELEHWGSVLGCVASDGAQQVLREEQNLQVRHGAVSCPSYLLQALPLKCVRLPARESHVAEVEVTKANPVVVWQFDVEHFDVGFTITDPEGVEVYPASRFSADGTMVEGLLCRVSSTPERLLLRWDNSYSVRRSKRVRYRVSTVSEAARSAAEHCAGESMRAAIWRCLAERASPGTSLDPLWGVPPSLELSEEPLTPVASASSSRASLLYSSSSSVADESCDVSSTKPRTSSSASIISLPSSTGSADAFWSYLYSLTENLVVGQMDPSKPAAHCGICDEAFGFFRRNHCCRMCGGIYCLPCSRHHVSINGKPSQRVCARCYLKLRDQREAANGDVSSPLSVAVPCSPSSAYSEGLDSCPSEPSPTQLLSPLPPSAASSLSSPYEELQGREGMDRYFRMLKMGVPDSAVAQKMKAEGVEESYVNIFLAGPGGCTQQDSEEAAPSSLSPPASTSGVGGSRGTTGGNVRDGRRTSLRQASSSSMRLRSVYWEELTPDRLTEKSVFKRKSTVAQSIGQDPSASALPAQDVKDLAQLFSAKAAAVPAATPRKENGGGKGRTSTSLSVLDPRRVQNVGICSSYFRRAFSSTDDLITSLLTLNRDKIPIDRISSLLEVIPTPDEQKKLQPLLGTPASTQLCEAEAFMMSLTKVPRMIAKARSFQLCLSFEESARELDDKVERLLRTCRDVMGSDRLVRVLEVLLLIGNTMNSYSSASLAQVQGFTVDSLLQVVLTKSNRGNLTLLDYFVKLAAEKGEGDILNVAEDMPTLELAVGLPDTSSLIKELRLWLREFDESRVEVQNEKRELDAYKQERLARKEARLRAIQEKVEAERRAEEERRQAAEKARKEEERKRQEVLARAEQRIQMKRALSERLAIEVEDGRRWRGQHFFAALSEFESSFSTEDPAFLRELCILMGYPPVPKELDDHLMEGETPLEGMRRINHELGGVDGEDKGQQGLLRLASRWLAAHTRVEKILGTMEEQSACTSQDPSAPMLDTTTTATPPPPSPSSSCPGASTPAAASGPPPPPRPVNPLVGRSALLASIAGGGLKGLKKRSGGVGSSTPAVARKGLSSSSSAPNHHQHQQDEEDERVEYEDERRRFTQLMGSFLIDTETRVKRLTTKSKELERAAIDLREYFGEDGAGASSATIFSTLWRFLQALQKAKGSYEAKHGRILTPSMMEDLAVVAVVGQRLATTLGVGAVEAVRLRDHTLVIRLAWGGVAYLRQIDDVIIKAGDRVVTRPWGPGIVLSVRKIVGVYEVQLGWGSRLFCAPSQIRKASCRRDGSL